MIRQVLGNELMYDLESTTKIIVLGQRQFKWQKKIFQFDPSYNISEVATAVKWSHIG